MVLPENRETIFFAGDTGPAATQVQYRLIFSTEEGILENIMAALRFLIDEQNWNANSSGQLDAYLQSLQNTVELFEPMDTIGTVAWFAGDPSNIPENSLLCDGTSYSRDDFPLLFAAIGTVWGSASSSEFNVPDLRGRSAIGSGTGSGLTTRFVGQFTGEEAHTLIGAEVPSHQHTYQPAGVAVVSAPGAVPTDTPGVIPGLTGSSGGDGAHNNMQPSAVLVPIIWAI